MSQIIPRVTGASLNHEYKGRVVRVVGRVVSKTNNSAIIETADNVKIEVFADDFNVNDFACENIEIVGMSEGNSTLRKYHVTDFGNDFDLNLYGQMLTLVTGKHKALFV